MSFFKKSLRALGFGNEQEQEEHIYSAKDITDVTGQNKQRQGNDTDNGSKQNAVESTDTTPSQPTETILPDALLNKVIELVNASFPDFVRNYIDIEGEKRYIYEQLGDSFKEYIENLNKTAREQSENAVASIRKKLEEEIASMRRKTTELEEQKAEIKNAQLSAERQKRALNDKVHDLDNRIATLEAEKEQYDLENKSLLNKLKVSGVKQQEVDDANEEIKRLLGVIQEMKLSKTPSEGVQQELADKNAAIDALQERIKYLTSQKDEYAEKIDTISSANAQMQAAINEKENVITQLTDEVAALIKQQEANTQQLSAMQATEQASAMLQSSLEESRKHCAELEQTIAELKANQQANNSEVENINFKLSEAQQESNRLATELQEAQARIKEQDDTSEKATQLLQQAEAQAEQARNEAASIGETLHSKIEENSNLHNRIDELQEALAQSEQQLLYPA